MGYSFNGEDDYDGNDDYYWIFFILILILFIFGVLESAFLLFHQAQCFTHIGTLVVSVTCRIIAYLEHCLKDFLKRI